MFRQIRTIIATAGLALAAPVGAQAEEPYPIEWTRQLGTSSQDYGCGLAVDQLGNVFISGYTSGSLGGPNAGGPDAFVCKYDSSGSLLWTRQLGTAGSDKSWDVAADGLGNVFISGYTHGSLGGPNAGGDDAFVTKYDASGNLVWTCQLGTSGEDWSLGVAPDGLGNVFISGRTSGSLGGPNAGKVDAFVSSYDAAGNLLWTRQLGTSDSDPSSGVAADGLGNVFISGYTYGSLGGPNAGGADAFVSKFDAAGSLVWTRQLGTSDREESYAVAADGLGNVFISGVTDGGLGPGGGGGLDAFVSKYDGAGKLLWVRQLGTGATELSEAVSADGLGNVYISGYTRGSLGGPNAGSGDAFVSKYAAAGSLLWTRQLGTSDWDASCAVAADRLGNVYFSGGTAGSLGGPNAGSYDAFLVKLVPEPGTFALLGLGGLALIRRRRAAGHRAGQWESTGN